MEEGMRKRPDTPTTSGAVVFGGEERHRAASYRRAVFDSWLRVRILDGSKFLNSPKTVAKLRRFGLVRGDDVVGDVSDEVVRAVEVGGDDVTAVLLMCLRGEFPQVVEEFDKRVFAMMIGFEFPAFFSWVF